MIRSLLITGGAGYLGSHILHRLLKSNGEFKETYSQFERVDVIDDLSTGFIEALPEVFRIKDSKFRFFKIDLKNESACKEFFANNQYGTIIHLAGRLKVADSIADPLGFYISNVVILLNILKNISSKENLNFIFSSTAAVYGNSDLRAPINEDCQLEPISAYGKSKLICEQILADYKSANPGFNFVALRYFNIAGASDDLLNGQRTSLPYHLIHVAAKVAIGRIPKLEIYGDKKSTKDGTCIRDYIHVEDLVDIHLLAIDYLKDDPKYLALNCGYQIENSVKDVISAMEIALGSKLNVSIVENRIGDPDYAVAANELIKREFEWKPQRANIIKICKSALEWERRFSQP